MPTAAADADVAIVAVGGNTNTCRENVDIDDIRLTAAQRQLVRDVHATGTPVVLVTLHGRPQSIPWEAKNIPAIIEGFYLGQECGRALADVIFGNVSPGGKLPAAVPRSSGQLPVLYNALWWASPKLYAGNGQESSALFAFGYGLSYTAFEFSSLRLDPPIMAADGATTATVTVTNTGNRSGDEVVQLYITDDYASIARPMRELRGFKRISLNPGQQQTVSFPITFEALKFCKDGQWVVEPGTFQVWLGNSSACTDRVALVVEE